MLFDSTITKGKEVEKARLSMGKNMNFMMRNARMNTAI
jgi:hypothetical protein